MFPRRKLRSEGLGSAACLPLMRVSMSMPSLLQPCMRALYTYTISLLVWLTSTHFSRLLSALAFRGFLISTTWFRSFITCYRYASALYTFVSFLWKTWKEFFSKHEEEKLLWGCQRNTEESYDLFLGREPVYFWWLVSAGGTWRIMSSSLMISSGPASLYSLNSTKALLSSSLRTYSRGSYFLSSDSALLITLLISTADWSFASSAASFINGFYLLSKRIALIGDLYC